MLLNLDKTLRRGVIFPHTEQGAQYYLLFHKSNVGGPLFVKTADLENPSLFYIGDICQGSYEGQVIGNCFFTQVQHFCSGGVFCVAYTGMLKTKAETHTLKGKGFGLQLALKTPHYMMWNKKGSLTLVVTPSLASSIKESLEL
jgi:hypothetical protein